MGFPDRALLRVRNRALKSSYKFHQVWSYGKGKILSLLRLHYT